MSDGETTEPAAKRPRYLVLALIALALVGLEVCGEGYQILKATTDPAFASSQTSDLEPVVAAALRTQLEAFAEYQRTMQPLGVAQLLVGGLLVIVSVRGLFARTSASTLVQLGLANIVACIVGFVLSAPIRAQVVSALIALPDAQAPEVARWLPGIYALRLALPLVTLSLCIFGVTRPAAREFMRPASEQLGDEP